MKKEVSTDMNGTVSYAESFVKSGDAFVSFASGTATATFNPTTLVLSYKLTWSGLGSYRYGTGKCSSPEKHT